MREIPLNPFPSVRHYCIMNCFLQKEQIYYENYPDGGPILTDLNQVTYPVRIIQIRFWFNTHLLKELGSKLARRDP